MRRALWLKRLGLQAIIAAVVITIPLIVAAPLLTPDAYSAFAAALQTVIVGVTLLAALRTYHADSRDRRVDRVLALHEEFFEPSFQASRRALVLKLRAGQVPFSELISSQLNEDEYGARIQILRFFERVQAASAIGSLDDSLAASLLGSHAAWWDLALADDGKASRRALHVFATWSNDLAQSHSEDPLFENWGASRMREFGRTRRPAGPASPRALVVQDTGGGESPHEGLSSQPTTTGEHQSLRDA
ncbi:hypothetical protein [Micropruina glycogenica]|uniref:Uncharacterized protein n=1 Tax=Micropruina glycogenica TaxID=75385 RepID=A0A2N9JK14_9ACTN|nr:hypothetical protein [Micropruina glycogenica]SPD87787.1 protein of unknown function [Micropruina glycogenica]